MLFFKKKKDTHAKDDKVIGSIIPEIKKKPPMPMISFLSPLETVPPDNTDENEINASTNINKEVKGEKSK